MTFSGFSASRRPGEHAHLCSRGEPLQAGVRSRYLPWLPPLWEPRPRSQQGPRGPARPGPPFPPRPSGLPPHGPLTAARPVRCLSAPVPGTPTRNFQPVCLVPVTPRARFSRFAAECLPAPSRPGQRFAAAVLSVAFLHLPRRACPVNVCCLQERRSVWAAGQWPRDATTAKEHRSIRVLVQTAAAFPSETRKEDTCTKNRASHTEV